MFRRNPDAVALAIIGLFALALNAPRMILREAQWGINPIQANLQAEREELRAARIRLGAERQAMQAAAEALRNSIHR